MCFRKLVQLFKAGSGGKVINKKHLTCNCFLNISSLEK